LISLFPAKPHPADYCLHKFFIHDRRKNSDKKEKDLKSALLVLNALLEKEGTKNIVKAYQNLTQKEKKQISMILVQNGYNILAK
jgi:hypothetical protein